MHFKLVDPWKTFLNNIERQDEFNQFINWLELNQVKNQQQAKAVTDILDELKNDDNVDTSKWKLQTSGWIHKFDKVFSKTKSERMSKRKS